MKKFLLFSIMVTLVQVAGLAQDPIAEYFANYNLKFSSAAAGVVLNPAGNFTGSGLQVAGLSNSPRDITFTWIDNSQNEDGYKFQRKKAYIYWNFGCQTGPDAEYKTTHLEFLPFSTEQFRMFSYKGSDRSSYRYCSVEMLRPDLTITNPLFTVPFKTYQGDNINVRCNVENIGTYEAGASTLQIRLISSKPTVVLKSIPISSLAVGATSSINTYVKIPTWALGSCRIEVLADATNTILEIPGDNNDYSRPITVYYKENDDEDDEVEQPYFEILDFEFPSTVTWSNTYDITKIKIKNTGKIAGSPGKIYTAINNTMPGFDPNDVFCSDCSMSSIDISTSISVNETKEFSYNDFYVPTLFEGSGFLQVAVKNNDNIWEWMYTNLTIGDAFKSATYNDYRTGIDLELDNNIEVYPNPTSGIININIQNNKDLFVTIEIIDCFGRIIKSQDVSNIDKININIADQPKGLYYLRIINNEKINIQKVILE